MNDHETMKANPSSGSGMPGALHRGFRGLLRMYPAAHRARFGEEMEQVFRQQWAEAVRSGKAWVRARFVGGVVMDMMGGAVRERLSETVAALARGRVSARASRALVSLGLGALVMGGVVGITVAVTWALPEVYRSTARVQIMPVENRPGVVVDPFLEQTFAELLRSPEVLTRVAERLDLRREWSAMYLYQGTLQVPELVSLLSDRIQVRQYRLTHLWEVQVYERNPDLAAEIANALVTVVQEVGRRDDRVRLSVVDAASPGLRPVRPNVPLNVALGVGVGMALGLVTAGAVWLMLGRRRVPRVA